MYKVVSLFDGIGTGRHALNLLDKECEYHAYEVNEPSILVTSSNYEDVIQHGSVLEADFSIHKDVFLLIGGSECTDLSIAKRNRQGLEGPKSRLFWEYVRALNEINPKYFLFENNASMSKEDKQVITDALGVEPIMFDSRRVSAQMRKRFYWTNIPNITLPEEDESVCLQSMLDSGYADRTKSLCITCSFRYHDRLEKYFTKYNRQHIFEKFESHDEYVCYVAENGLQEVCMSDGSNLVIHGLYGVKIEKTYKTSLPAGIYRTRPLSVSETERIFGFPVGYVGNHLKQTEAKRVLGNAWDVNVIKYILAHIPEFK